jgi:DNA-binding beta-propeller fold protein YncE
MNGSVRRVPPLAALIALAALALAAPPASAHLPRFATSFTPGENGPNGVAVDQSTGAVYVAGYFSSNLEKFGPTGAQDASFVTPRLQTPWGVAVDNSADSSKGDVYVSELFNSRVLKLDSTGREVAGFTPIAKSSIPAGDPGSTGFEPSGVAVDPANGNVVVGDVTNGEVDIFSSSGAFVSQFKGGEGRGLAVGAGSVIFTTGGEGAQEWTPSSGYSTPKTISPEFLYGIGVDLATGNVFADDFGHIAEYSASGTPLLQFGAGILSFSLALAVNEKTDQVYVSDFGSGKVFIFGSPVAVAGVSTGTPASNVTSTTAGVSGVVNPEGTTVTGCRFEYGPSGEYGATAACSQAPPLTGETAIPVNASLAGLQPSAIYHYRLVATVAAGPSYGEDQTFQTQPAAPSLIGESVSALAQTTATLDATVNPNNQATTYHFEYGKSTAYGTTLPAPEGAVGTQYEDDVVGQQLTGLAPGAVYHYRVVATNATGSTAGPDQTFTTPPPQPPAVSTGPVSGVGPSSVTLSGTLETQGFETTYQFDIGTDTGYGTQIFADAGSTPGAQAFTVTLHGLAAGTVYHYRIAANNVFGTSYGADRTFTTPAVPGTTVTVPMASPLVATAIAAFPVQAAGSTVSAGASKPAAKHRRPKARTKTKKRKGGRRR